MTSGILHFPSGQCVFTCATQVEPYQRLQILGTQGRMEIDIPFNAPPEQHCPMAGRMFLVEARRCYNLSLVISTSVHDSRRSVFEKHTPGMELPVPLEGSVRNMAVIEAIFRSAGLSPHSLPAVRTFRSYLSRSTRTTWEIVECRLPLQITFWNSGYMTHKRNVFM
jgi:hypothetical protein